MHICVYTQYTYIYIYIYIYIYTCIYTVCAYICTPDSDECSLAPKRVSENV